MSSQMCAHTSNKHHTYPFRGNYYYRRRVPNDLLHEYRKPMIVIALKTKNVNEAYKIAIGISLKLERLWQDLRFNNDDIPAANLLHSSHNNDQLVPLFSNAHRLYLDLKGQDKNKSFYQSCDRAVSLFINYAGDIPLDRYSRKDANGLRNKLLKNGLAPQSVKRTFAILRTIFNISINEHALAFPNIFKSIEFGQIVPVKQRLPITDTDIHMIQKVCQQINDPNRWLIALISDTGLRLSEALGLSISDIQLDPLAPHIIIQNHPWRTLKTPSSQRLVPLVGKSLWAAKMAVSNARSDKVFPIYTNNTCCKSNSASSSLNKWLKKYLPENSVMHSFRHSLRDRLRAVQCPSDIIDDIGGWSGNKSVGQGYGQGYPLSVLHEWMERIVIG